MNTGILKFGKHLFKGISFGSLKNNQGEIVFTTSLTSYVETLSDPSYKNQILVFTQPLIGNYGVPSRIKENKLFKNFESDKIHASGIIVNDYSAKYSHWNSVESLSDWCKRDNIPALTNIDTRYVTNLIREHGTVNAEILCNENNTNQNNTNPNKNNIIKDISIKKECIYNENGILKIAVIDCGVKQSIIKLLIKRNIRVHLLPYNCDINIYDYEGIIISNGPGSPQIKCLIETTKKIINDKKIIPLFNICLGHQILGLAAGFNIYKMKHGHRSHNSPVINTYNGSCKISSQNHSYCISNKYIPKNWFVSFINANDNSIEGIKHSYLPYSSVQFHPESNGGPNDFEYLFDDFIDECLIFKKSNN